MEKIYEEVKIKQIGYYTKGIIFLSFFFGKKKRQYFNFVKIVMEEGNEYYKKTVYQKPRESNESVDTT